MPLKSIREKITNIASGEVLGTAETEKERKAKERETDVSPSPSSGKKKKKEKQPKEKHQKERAVSSDSFFKRRKTIQEEEEIGYEEEVKVKKEEEEDYLDLSSSGIDGYEDLLSILGIKQKTEVSPEFKSSDMDYVEFTQTTPLGFDFDEVTDFISRIKYTLNRYENALKQRDKDIVTLASEVKKVERRMIEQNEQKELERVLGGGTTEEMLLEENGNLAIEINRLKGLLEKSANSKEMELLKKENEVLKAENKMLTQKMLHGDEFNPTDDKKEENKGSLPEAGLPEIGLPSFEPLKENKSNRALPSIDITNPGDEFLKTLSQKKPETKDPFELALQEIEGEELS